MAHTKNNGRDKIQILFQDSHIIVINKPCGILSVPYAGSRAKTAQDIVEEILRKSGEANARHKPFAVHRLDRDTSGVMMFALTEQAKGIIMDTWHQMVTERLYRAVAENPVNKKAALAQSGTIEAPIALNAHNIGYVPKDFESNQDNSYQLKPNAVMARTNYRIIERGKYFTLFELSLDTGKKNQIRAHLSYKGYPLAGDKEHGSHSDPFGRLCLHARTLEFDHPFTGEHLKFEVPEPKEWLEQVKKEAKSGFAPKSEGKIRSRRKPKDDIEIPKGERRLTKKQLAHMSYIERGKYQQR